MGNNKDNVNQWFPGAENKRWTVETVEWCRGSLWGVRSVLNWFVVVVAKL